MDKTNRTHFLPSEQWMRQHDRISAFLASA